MAPGSNSRRVAVSVVHVGAPTTDVLSAAAPSLYGWLARSLLAHEDDVPVELPPGTRHLTAEEVNAAPFRIKELVLRDLAPSRPGSSSIIDVADSPYIFLRDPVLGHLADLSVSLAATRDHQVVVLLPRLPPRVASL